MRRKIVGAVIFAVILGCLCWLLDPVNRLELRLFSNPMWVNGFWGIARLGRDASAEKIVTEYWAETGHSHEAKGETPIRRIVETKSMWLLRSGDGTDCKAALVDGPEGRQILVMRYSGAPANYWSIRPQR